MEGNYIIRFFLIGLVILTGPLAGQANGSKPYPEFHVNFNMMIRSPADTLPDNKKTVSENAGTKQSELIKEVPKSHKQVKPIAIPVTGIKPVQIIKPKIIRPIIKIN
ncbi:MAG: hypothetical protein NVSMB7_14260 [Chitinophagaceae bacterium]